MGLQSDKDSKRSLHDYFFGTRFLSCNDGSMAFTMAVVGFSIGSLLGKCSKKKPAEEPEEEEEEGTAIADESSSAIAVESETANAVDSGSAAHAARPKGRAAHAARPTTGKLTRSFGTQTLKALLRTTTPRRMHYSDGISWQIKKEEARQAERHKQTSEEGRLQRPY